MDENPWMIVPLRLTLVAFWVAGGVFSSCNQPFDPRGDLDERPVVFSLLSTDRDVQFVRVERSYMPAGYDPLAYTSDNFVSDAAVTITNSGLTMRLRDTTLLRSDTSRFKGPLRAYVISPLRPLYGSSYAIRVESQQRVVATASVSIPTKPFLSIDLAALAVLDRPTERDSTAEIIFPITLGNGATGYIGRFFVDYEVLKDGEWVAERVEVPTGFAYPGLHDFNYVTYGQLKPRPYMNRTSGLYTNQFYTHVLVDIAFKKYPSAKIIFDRVAFQLLQADQNLYNYSMVTHSYRDPQSIRLDEPNYSNIAGGVGMVGSYTLDSVTHTLPDFFVFNRR